jgi:S1-C subfamily serine protease
MPSPDPSAGRGRTTSPRLPVVLIAVTALLAAVLLVAGCGDEETTTTAVSDGTTTTATQTSDDGGTHHIGIGDFSAQDVYADAAPSVVTIRSIFGNLNSIGGGGGQGSGFVISDDGEIVTNAHVVTDAEQGGGSAAGSDGEINAADEVYVEFPDRNQVEAEIIGFDPNADVALLKVDPDGLDLQPLEFGDSAAVEVGTPVAAIGSPFGQEQSLSTGIVSATDRSIDSLTAFAIDGAVQTDASINPGNSGGPLITADGKVIGINQQINTTSGGNEGVGFAVPSNLVQRSVEDLRPDGKAEYAFIGVSTIPLYPQLAERLDVDAPTGALVIKTTQGGPAADAGIEGAGNEKIEFQGQEINVGGDVIVSVDGEKLESETDLSRLISEHKPGDQIQVEVIRDGDRETIDVTLEARPDSL